MFDESSTLARQSSKFFKWASFRTRTWKKNFAYDTKESKYPLALRFLHPFRVLLNCRYNCYKEEYLKKAHKCTHTYLILCQTFNEVTAYLQFSWKVVVFTIFTLNCVKTRNVYFLQLLASLAATVKEVHVHMLAGHHLKWEVACPLSTV